MYYLASYRNDSSKLQVSHEFIYNPYDFTLSVNVLLLLLGRPIDLKWQWTEEPLVDKLWIDNLKFTNIRYQGEWYIWTVETCTRIIQDWHILQNVRVHDEWRQELMEANPISAYFLNKQILSFKLWQLLLNQSILIHA